MVNQLGWGSTVRYGLYCAHARSTQIYLLTYSQMTFSIPFFFLMKIFILCFKFTEVTQFTNTWINSLLPIYIIITKNICYLLWNWGFWCSLNNTYPIFLTCIRCTNHLCDSCDLTDVHPHFISSLLRMIQNVDLLWRHRYKSRPLAIVTSQWSIVPAWLLWTQWCWGQ